MSIEYRDLYIKKMDRLGKNRRERSMKSKQREFAKYFEDALNREDCYINGKPSELIFQDHSQSNNKDLSDDKYVIAENSTDIGVGSYVYWRDKEWLVFTEEEKTIPTHQQLKIKTVNWKIKWLDENGNISEYGAYVQSQTLYTLGVATNGDYISIENGKMMMYVQNNPDTIKHLGVGRRVFIGESVYKIMFSDAVPRRGLINLLMEQDTKNEYDNTELGIADYYKLEDQSDDVDVIETDAVIIGEETARVGRTYTYKVSEGFEVSEWVIDYIEEVDQPFYVQERSSKDIVLRFKDDFRYVGSNCNIIAKLTDGSIISFPIRVIKRF